MYDHEGPDGGSLYRLDPDLRVTRMLHPVSIANGLDWTDDGREMLYIDTTTQRVDRIEYDAETGDLGARRPWVTIPDGAGSPGRHDPRRRGMRLGRAVGRRLRRALLAGWHSRCRASTCPAASASSCAFGGPDLDQLIITTAQWPDPATALPGAGGLYVARPGVRGRPPTAFAG